MKKKLPGHRRITGEFKKLAKQHMKCMETAQMSPYFFWEGRKYRIIIIHSLFSRIILNPGGRIYIITDDQARNIKDKNIFIEMLRKEFHFYCLINQSSIIKSDAKSFDAKNFANQKKIFDQVLAHIEKEGQPFTEREIDAFRTMAYFIGEKNKLKEDISFYTKQLQQIHKRLKREKPIEWDNSNVEELHNLHDLHQELKIKLDIRLLETIEERMLVLNNIIGKLKNIRMKRVIKGQLVGQQYYINKVVSSIELEVGKRDIPSCISYKKAHTYESDLRSQSEEQLVHCSLINETTS
ncbi:hypothetical protein J2S78_001305 [Salibacterium salarium]|uniref:hypothetical protein n=1 Tax=Salibacterium salarium TaxID=284579 RepID=UPI0027898736|nr:hypothetical protein [Salibacterium salarium]MDQ0298885.1 hypothetical protein [Salibacterium salarium]